MENSALKAPGAQGNPPGWKGRFFALWGGQALSLLGSELVQFALIWHLTEKTGSAITLATASLVGLLPQVLFSPVIGALVDRWNRRLIMVVADSVIALATTILAMLFAFNRVDIWHIYLLLFIRAVGDGFHSSAMGASTVLLVPKEHLSRVQGLNQTLNGGMNIFAAPLGALLLKLLPMQGVLAIDVLTALLALGPLLIFTVPQPERQQTGLVKASVWEDMREGMRYVLAWPGLMIVLGMAALINFLLTPTLSLLPLLVTKHFGGDALHLGWLNSAQGIGVIAGGLLLSLWGGFKHRMVTAMGGLVGIGIGVLLVGAAPASAIWLALGAMVLAGSMVSITNGSLGALLQSVIAPEVQGRVFAFVFSLASAMAPLGLMIAGPVADAAGVRVWFWLGGSACALMGVIGFLLPAVMRLERQAVPRAATIQLTSE